MMDELGDTRLSKKVLIEIALKDDEVQVSGREPSEKLIDHLADIARQRRKRRHDEELKCGSHISEQHEEIEAAGVVRQQ